MHMHMSMGARRWGVPLEGYSGEEYLQALAERRFTVCCAPVLCPSVAAQGSAVASGSGADSRAVPVRA